MVYNNGKWQQYSIDCKPLKIAAINEYKSSFWRQLERQANDGGGGGGVRNQRGGSVLFELTRLRFLNG